MFIALGEACVVTKVVNRSPSPEFSFVEDDSRAYIAAYAHVSSIRVLNRYSPLLAADLLVDKRVPRWRQGEAEKHS